MSVSVMRGRFLSTDGSEAPGWINRELGCLSQNIDSRWQRTYILICLIKRALIKNCDVEVGTPKELYASLGRRRTWRENLSCATATT